MAGRPFEKPPKFKNRMILMIAGICLQALGLSLLIQLDLGTDPCSCFTLGVQKHLPFSYGTVQLIINLITFIFVIFNDLGMIGFGTIGNMIVLGYLVDFFTWVWGMVLPGGLRFVWLAISCLYRCWWYLSSVRLPTWRQAWECPLMMGFLLSSTVSKRSCHLKRSAESGISALW